MKALTTQKAFEEIINQRGIYSSLGVKEEVIRNYRRRIKAGDIVSIEKMEDILKKAGAKVVQEKLWEMPVNEGKKS